MTPLDTPCHVPPGARLGRNRHVRVGGRQTGAHRAAWERVNGPIPPGMCVLHSCDNRPCDEPTHLFLGTKGENNADRDRKGRTAHGEGHGRAVLTEAHVRCVRIRYAAGGMSITRLAAWCGVGTSQMWRVLLGDEWADVGGPIHTPRRRWRPDQPCEPNVNSDAACLDESTSPRVGLP